jgi:hypothetical protein
MLHSPAELSGACRSLSLCITTGVWRPTTNPFAQPLRKVGSIERLENHRAQCIMVHGRNKRDECRRVGASCFRTIAFGSSSNRQIKHKPPRKIEFRSRNRNKQPSSTSTSAVHSSISSPGMKKFPSIISHLSPSILEFD